MAYFRPAMACASLIHVFALEQLFAAHSRYFFVRPVLVNLCIAVVVCFAFSRSMLRGGTTKSILTWELLIYIILIAYVATTGLWADTGKALHQVYSTLPYLAAAILVALTVANSRDVDGFIVGLIYLGVPLVAAIALSPYFGVGGMTAPWRSDIYGNDIRLNYLQIGFSAGVVLVCISSRDVAGNKFLNVLSRFVVCVITIYVMVKSGARGQTLLSVIAAGLVFLWSGGGNRFIRNYFMLTFVMFSAVWLLALFISDVWTVSGSNRWSVSKVMEDASGRLELAVYGLIKWAQSIYNMIFGIGHYSIASAKGAYPHIVPLEVLAEEGMVGFGLYFALLISFLRKGFRNAFSMRRSNVWCGDDLILLVLIILSFLLSLKQGTVLGNWMFFLFGLMVCALHKHRLPICGNISINTALVKPNSLMKRDNGKADSCCGYER